MLPSLVFDILYYVSEEGRTPFEEWFWSLDSVAALKVATAIKRLRQGNISNVKSLSEGVLEYRINTGPGFRIYFGLAANQAILLTGGIKRSQQQDIERAKTFWASYKRRMSR